MQCEWQREWVREGNLKSTMHSREDRGGALLANASV